MSATGMTEDGRKHTVCLEHVSRFGAASEVKPGILNTPEARVMRLRGYGNAIVPPLAAEFVGAVMEALGAENSHPAKT